MVHFQLAFTEWLFTNHPRIVVHVIGRRRLIENQLVSFGKNSLTYRIWGQVVAGYVNTHSLRAALTAQLVEDRQHRLGIQVVAPPELLEALANAPENQRSASHRIHEALAEGRRQARSLTYLWQGAKTKTKRAEARDKGFSVLRHLAHSIERKGRQQQRRTIHAEMRGNQHRPVHKAYDDLVSAAFGDFYEDRFKKTVVVLGKAGRLHAFNEEGKHITSLVLQKDELERRKNRKRYLLLDPEHAERLRARALSAKPTYP